MKDISVVVRYYDQPQMLDYQLGVWARYPEAVRRHLTLVLVDDGSPTPAAPIVQASGLLGSAASVRVYRTLVDVPWNQEFATNLGVSQVETAWLLHLDLDHEAPADTLLHLIEKTHDRESVYLFQRRWSDGRPRTMAPGLWFLTREMFDRAGGLEGTIRGPLPPQ